MLGTENKINTLVVNDTSQIKEIRWEDYVKVKPKAELIYKMLIKEEQPYYTKTNIVGQIIIILL